MKRGREKKRATIKKKRLLPDALGLKGINKMPFEYTITGKFINRTVKKKEPRM
jgi:hypothetical protein